MPGVNMNINQTQFEDLEGFFVYGNPTAMDDLSKIRHMEIFWKSIFEIIILITCVTSIASSIILLRIFCINPRMRTKGTIYFSHFALWSLVDTIVFLLLFQVYVSLDWVFPPVMGCLVFPFCEFVRISEEFMLIAPGIDWFLVSTDSRFVRKYNKFAKFFVTIIYSLSLISFILIMTECFVETIFIWFQFFLNLLFRTFSCITVLVLNIKIKNSLFCSDEPNTKYQLKVSTRGAAFLVPFLITSYIYLFVFHWGGYRSEGLSIVLNLLYNISEIFLLCIPSLVVYTLFRHNEDFRAAVAANRLISKFCSKNVQRADSNECGAMDSIETRGVPTTPHD